MRNPGGEARECSSAPVPRVVLVAAIAFDVACYQSVSRRDDCRHRALAAHRYVAYSTRHRVVNCLGRARRLRVFPRVSIRATAV